MIHKFKLLLILIACLCVFAGASCVFAGSVEDTIDSDYYTMGIDLIGNLESDPLTIDVGSDVDDSADDIDDASENTHHKKNIDDDMTKPSHKNPVNTTESHNHHKHAESSGTVKNDDVPDIDCVTNDIEDDVRTQFAVNLIDSTISCDDMFIHDEFDCCEHENCNHNQNTDIHQHHDDFIIDNGNDNLDILHDFYSQTTNTNAVVITMSGEEEILYQNRCLKDALDNSGQNGENSFIVLNDDDLSVECDDLDYNALGITLNSDEIIINDYNMEYYIFTNPYIITQEPNMGELQVNNTFISNNHYSNFDANITLNHEFINCDFLSITDIIFCEKCDLQNVVNQKGTFSDLQKEIDNANYGSVLDLYRDYYANGGSTIELNKDLTIDGHGHTIDCEKICSAFHSSKGKIVLMNLKIINGESKENGGAIYLDGDSDRCPYFVNCTFINNHAAKDGGAIANFQQRFYSLIDMHFMFFPISVENCTFIGNSAGQNGGAIAGHNNMNLIFDCVSFIKNSLFDSNHAVNHGGAVYEYLALQVYDSVFHGNVAEEGSAGAICASVLDLLSCSFSQNTAKKDAGAVSGSTIEFFNSTFNDNSAGDNAGAIWASILRNSEDVNSSFINNRACGKSGGAIYANSVNIKNVLFSGNSADVDGGAIYATDGVIVNNCSFESNKADGATFSQCYGGAICSKGEVYSTDCKYRKNYAYDYGGAIYADKVVLKESSCFEDNTAYDNHGGAIYTNKFSGDVTDAVFTGNFAGEDGGAIYIYKENQVTFSHCVFENNHCGDEGGAIYLDSSSSHLTLTNNVFKGNKADDEGQCVFNCGYYDSISNNFWGGKNPSSGNDQLIEWKWIGSNVRHSDSNPSSIDFSSIDDLKLDMDLSDLNGHFAGNLLL